MLHKGIIYFICYSSSEDKLTKALSHGRQMKATKSFILNLGSKLARTHHYATSFTFKSKLFKNLRRKYDFIH
ncbi:hypothetical protein VAE151_550230 [Vibrio aestuarianus]|uniref:Uncharacterized protein n=1 Tax=Vibrio aestuarianus TaxID=28171 RepID=A0ABM9FPK8_9VIBR|nr:hypothetical protein VAE308_1050231 [Vibrio aestuarianus]CAH8193405.1 hypothetical protein VIBAE_A30826 [Vibrio aestuarianus subsp. francensis]CAH8193652.1 hypothetical protein VAE055_370230 [Vibrio aestuarianus]CAH8193853.1 hypothetical protein VAE128_460231 [Vibrio aestuarianus]CAH8194055.1 hypothetical protein VAE130_570231 [Vibrio aestuarianus]